MKEPCRILLIDDDASVVRLLVRTLETTGWRYTLSIARNGAEGIDKLHAFKPELVITDIMMPEKDGFAVCLEVRGSYSREVMKLLVMSGSLTEDDREKVIRYGADGVIEKPFNLNVFLSHIKALCPAVETIPHRVA